MPNNNEHAELNGERACHVGRGACEAALRRGAWGSVIVGGVP